MKKSALAIILVAAFALFTMPVMAMSHVDGDTVVLELLGIAGLAALGYVWSDKIKKLNEDRSDVLNEMQDIAGKDEPTAEELEKFETLKAKMEGLDKQIKNATLVENKEKEFAQKQFYQQDELIQSYSLREAIHDFIENGRPTGKYAEFAQEAEKEADRAGITLTGSPALLIPQAVLSGKVMNQMQAGQATDGGNAIATELRSFIDKLRERLVLSQLGADFLTGLVGNVDFPTESVLPTLSWKTEIDDHSESSPKVGKKQIRPKRAGTYVDISNLLIRQTSPSIDARIDRQLIGTAQRGLEYAGIAGSGENEEPLGILNTLGVWIVAGGDNGAEPTFGHVVDLETAISDENADIGSLGYLTNARGRGTLKQTKVDAGSGIMVWQNNEMNGYRALVSNLVPKNLEKGNRDDLSALIFGNWNDLVIGQWGGIEILFDPYTQGLKGITRLILNMYADVLVTRPVSFSAMKDMIVTVPVQAT